MAEKYAITKSLLDGLANDINDAAGESGAKTIAQMRNSVQNLSSVTGLPDGGATGQILAKKSNASQDVQWVDAPKDGTDGVDGVDGYTPVKGTDYWTEADRTEIVEAVLEQMGASVIGSVDENNVITLTGDLAGGTYTLKYELEDGTKTTIGSLVLEGAPGAYTNVLPTALGNDGTVLRNKSGEALGYADGCYLSGNATNAWQNVTYVGDDSSHFLTGFIHYTKAQAAAETPIYIKGVTIDTSQSHSRIAGYNNYDADSYHDPVKLSAGQVTVDKLGEKYYRLTPTASFVSTMGASTVGSDFRYIRLSLSGSGAGCVITIDEPIS